MWEIQTRQKGAWQRYIRATPAAAQEAWEGMQRIPHPAARLVEVDTGKVKAAIKATNGRARR